MQDKRARGEEKDRKTGRKRNTHDSHHKVDDVHERIIALSSIQVEILILGQRGEEKWRKKDHFQSNKCKLWSLFFFLSRGEVIRSPSQAEMDAVTLLTLVYEMVISNAMAYFFLFSSFLFPRFFSLANCE